MAISTLDGVIAGMQWTRTFAKAVTGTLVAGRPCTTWALGGNPGAGSYDTTLNGVALSASQSGQLPWTDPGAGNSYLARMQAAATQAGVLVLADRLWHNGGYGITTTTAQSTTFPGLPSRDSAGAANGDGVLCALEVSAACGAAAPVLTIGYTNSAGTASRTATSVDLTQNSPIAATMYRFGLQAGDIGIRSIQSLTIGTSWVSGTVNLVLYRPLCYLELPLAGTPNAVDALTSGFPQMYNGSVPYLFFIPSTTTTSNISGSVVWTQG